MPWNKDLKPLLVIIGPTAVGKTEFSIRLASILDGEIVSADSRYFYRGMDIGTAKPTLEERKDVPHHLIDVSDPDRSWSLTIFQSAAKAIIQDIHERGRLPILVGGTGQFVRAVVEDWRPPSQEPDPRLRQVLETWGKEIGAAELHRKLKIIDPQAAMNMDANNMRRAVRALEVIFNTGIRFSDQSRVRHGSPYTLMQIGLTRPREELYARIDARISQMIQCGWLEEVQALIQKGYPVDAPAMSAIGYREIIQVLQGELTIDEAVVQMKRLTRQFVRRQANWFKISDTNIDWQDANNLRIDEIVDQVRLRLGYIK